MVHGFEHGHVSDIGSRDVVVPRRGSKCRSEFKIGVILVRYIPGASTECCGAQPAAEEQVIAGGIHARKVSKGELAAGWQRDAEEVAEMNSRCTSVVGERVLCAVG